MGLRDFAETMLKVHSPRRLRCPVGMISGFLPFSRFPDRHILSGRLAFTRSSVALEEEIMHVVVLEV